MIILGIDPALVNLGWAIISCENQNFRFIKGGVIKTTANEAIHKRLATISLQLRDIILQYKPAIVAMEETFINCNAESSLKLGYARGAIMATVGKLGIEFKEFKPNVIKKTLVGTGHATKEQIIHMIKLLIRGTDSIEDHNLADAVAVAYTCSVYL